MLLSSGVTPVLCRVSNVGCAEVGVRNCDAVLCRNGFGVLLPVLVGVRIRRGDACISFGRVTVRAGNIGLRRAFAFLSSENLR